MTYRHFKMDNLKTALPMVRKDCYMSSIDLSNANYSIPVAICGQKYLMFQFVGQLYKFVCLSNALTSTPGLFTKILKPGFAALHKEDHDIMGILDDSILFGHNYDECKAAALRTLTLFQSFDFQVYPKKSSLIPKQEIDLLGFTTSSKNMTLKLTRQKCNNILKNLDVTLKHANNTTITEFSKILDMLEAATPGVKYGRLHLFHSVKCKNQALTLSKGSYNCYFKLSSESIVEVNWWKANTPKSYNTIHKELPKKIIYSDACPNVWGEVPHENMSSGGHWSVEESKLDINVLELLATYHALQIYCKNMFDTSVHLKVDNTTAVVWINKQTTPTASKFSVVKQI